jgi:hypothetical protein
MRVKEFDDLLADVVESDADPSGWRAVGGDRSGGIGEDLYLAHPQAGAFQLKTFAKNPFQVEGVGTRIARSIDDDLDPLFPDRDREDPSGMFGVQEPIDDEQTATERAKRLETVLETHSDAPTNPEDLLTDMMDAIESPAYGPMEFDGYDRPDRLDRLSRTFEEAESVLDAELEDLIDEDIERGFY